MTLNSSARLMSSKRTDVFDAEGVAIGGLGADGISALQTELLDDAGLEVKQRCPGVHHRVHLDSARSGSARTGGFQNRIRHVGELDFYNNFSDAVQGAEERHMIQGWNLPEKLTALLFTGIVSAGPFSIGLTP